MNKKLFLDELHRLLSDLPPEERNQAIKYYEDYFEDAGPENEQAILKELGSPQELANQIKEQHRMISNTVREVLFTDRLLTRSSMHKRNNQIHKTKTTALLSRQKMVSNKVTNKPATVSITMATGRPTMLSTTTTTTISRPTTVSAATTTSRPAMLSITMATGRPTMLSTTTAISRPATVSAATTISRQPPDTIAIISSNQHAKLCGSFCLLSLQLRSDFLVCLCYSESSLQSSL